MASKVMQEILGIQKSQQAMLEVHDLILNGHEKGDVPGLVTKHKETRQKVDEHDEYIRRKRLWDGILHTLGGAVGGVITVLLVEYIKTKFL